MTSHSEPTLCNRIVAFLFSLITMCGLRFTILNKVLFFPPAPSSYTVLTGFHDDTVESWPPLRKPEDRAGEEQLKRDNFSPEKHHLKKKILFQFNHSDGLAVPFSTPNVFLGDVPIPYLQRSEVEKKVKAQRDKNAPIQLDSIHTTWPDQHESGCLTRPEYLQPQQTSPPTNLNSSPPSPHKTPSTIPLCFIPYPILHPQIPHIVHLPFETQQSYILTPSLYDNTPQQIDYSTTTLFFSHGNATDVGQMYEWCYSLSQQFQANIVIYDYLGYGGSQGGKTSPKNLLASGENALLYVLDNFPDRTKNVILYGQSIGSTVTCNLGYKFCNITPPTEQIEYEKNNPTTNVQNHPKVVSPRSSITTTSSANLITPSTSTTPIFYHSKYNTTQKAMTHSQREHWVQKFKIHHHRQHLNRQNRLHPHNSTTRDNSQQPYELLSHPLSPYRYHLLSSASHTADSAHKRAKDGSNQVKSHKDDLSHLLSQFLHSSDNPTHPPTFIYPPSNQLFNYVFADSNDIIDTTPYTNYPSTHLTDLPILSLYIPTTRPGPASQRPKLPQNLQHNQSRRKSVSSFDFLSPLTAPCTLRYTPGQTPSPQPRVTFPPQLQQIEHDSLNTYRDLLKPQKVQANTVINSDRNNSKIKQKVRTKSLTATLSLPPLHLESPRRLSKRFDDHSTPFDSIAQAVVDGLAPEPRYDEWALLNLPLFDDSPSDLPAHYHPSTYLPNPCDVDAKQPQFPYTPSLQLSYQCHLPPEFNEPISTDPTNFHFFKWLPEYIFTQDDCNDDPNNLTLHPFNSHPNTPPQPNTSSTTTRSLSPHMPRNDSTTELTTIYSSLHDDSTNSLNPSQPNAAANSDHIGLNVYANQPQLGSDNELHEFSVLVSSKMNPMGTGANGGADESILRPTSMLEHQPEYNDHHLYRNPSTSSRIKGIILHSGLQSVLSCVDPSINLHNSELKFKSKSIKQVKHFVTQSFDPNTSSNPKKLIHLSEIDLTPVHNYKPQTISHHKGHFMDILVNAVLAQYISCPILLLHGCQDHTVPIAGAHAVYDNAPFCVEPLFVHAADHNDVEQHTGPMYFDTIRAFLHNICCDVFPRSIYNVARYDCPTLHQPLIKQFWHWYQDHQYQLRLYNIFLRLKHISRQSIFDTPPNSKWYYCCGQVSHDVQYVQNILKDFFAKEALQRRKVGLAKCVYEQIQDAIDTASQPQQHG